MYAFVCASFAKVKCLSSHRVQTCLDISRLNPQRGSIESFPVHELVVNGHGRNESQCHVLAAHFIGQH